MQGIVRLFNFAQGLPGETLGRLGVTPAPLSQASFNVLASPEYPQEITEYDRGAIRALTMGRSRLIMAGAPILRTLSGLRAIKMAPAFDAPPPPVNAMTLATAGWPAGWCTFCRLSTD